MIANVRASSTRTLNLQTFEIAIASFRELGTALTRHHGHVGGDYARLAPFFLLLERQCMVAFDALVAQQAYQAWVSMRPGVESVLIIGKWLHDVARQIWERRFDDPRPYQREYQGKNLGVGALPEGSRVQSALKYINDTFLHPNPRYYYRHLAFEDLEDGRVEMRVDFFDDETEVHAGILGIMHLTLFMQDQLFQALAGRMTGRAALDVNIKDFRTKSGEWAASVMSQGPYFWQLMIEAGLWPDLLNGGVQ